MATLKYLNANGEWEELGGSGIQVISSLDEIAAAGVYNLNNEEIYVANAATNFDYAPIEVGDMTRVGAKYNTYAWNQEWGSERDWFTATTSKLDTIKFTLTDGGSLCAFTYQGERYDLFQGSAEFTLDTDFNGTTLRSLGIIYLIIDTINEEVKEDTLIYKNTIATDAELVISKIEGGVGKLGETETSIVLNDLEENIAYSNYSTAEGRTTQAGAMAFNITAIDYTNKTFTLDDVTDLTTGMYYSAQIVDPTDTSNAFNTNHYGTITAISGNTVTVSAMPSEFNVSEIYPIEIVLDNFDNENNMFFTPDYPNLGTRPIGYATHAEGRSTVAGRKNAHAEGNKSKALGTHSHAENRSTVYGSYGHGEGYGTITYGDYGHTEGYGGHAIGTGSHVEGNRTKARGAYSHAQGTLSEANGDRSFAGGNTSIVGTSAADSLAFGHEVKVNGSQSIGLGHSNQIDAHKGVALGIGNKVGITKTGDNSKGAFALGDTNVVNGLGAGAIGLNNTVNATYASIAIGELNNVSNQASVAAGYSNTITGGQCFAAGMGHNVAGFKNIALGYGLNIDSGAEGRVVVGKFNEKTNDIFTVGIGTGKIVNGEESGVVRKNALTVTAAGKILAPQYTTTLEIEYNDGTTETYNLIGGKEE